MEDKELFDFFKNRSASFDEMPSNDVWNKIQFTIDATKRTPSSFFSKRKALGILTLAAVVVIAFFIPKNFKSTLENEIPNQQENEIIKDSHSATTGEIIKKVEIDSVTKTVVSIKDTLKPKKVFIKKEIVLIKADTTSVIKTLIPVFNIDSIETFYTKIEMNSLKIKPQVKGNRLLYETKQELAATEFDSFVSQVLRETKTNYGALIVIKAKGNKPFRQIVKFPEKTFIPKVTIPRTYYSTKLIVKDSMIIKDSIYFNIKK